MKKILALVVFLFCNQAEATFEFVNGKTSNGVLRETFLEELKSVFHPDIFFETGTYSGDNVMGAAPYFNEIVTVELHDGLAEAAKRKFSTLSHIRAYHGSSPDIIREVAPTLQGTILFWLDAHYSGEGTALSFADETNPDAITAIRGELAAIRELGIGDCIILIDDIRGFGMEIGEVQYLGCWAYPSMQEVAKSILQINPNFGFALLGDMFLAYDTTKYHPIFSEVVKACTGMRLYDGVNATEEQLIAWEQTIRKAPSQEGAYIQYLYSIMTEYGDAMFLHDLWYGLVELENKNYQNAYKALEKVVRRSNFSCKKDLLDRTQLPHSQARIQNYKSFAQSQF